MIVNLIAKKVEKNIFFDTVKNSFHSYSYHSFNSSCERTSRLPCDALQKDKNNRSRPTINE